MDRLLRFDRGMSESDAANENGTYRTEAGDSTPVTLGPMTTPTIFQLPSGKTLALPTQSIRFQSWVGEPIADTYGGKALIDVDGKPMFAELAVLQLLQKRGWDGRWIDTYRGKFRIGWPDCSNLPPRQQGLFNRIVRSNGGRKGCWDVFAWNANSVLFVECKRLRKDKIRDTQIGWLSAALEAGVSADSFLVAEWDL